MLSLLRFSLAPDGSSEAAGCRGQIQGQTKENLATVDIVTVEVDLSCISAAADLGLGFDLI